MKIMLRKWCGGSSTFIVYKTDDDININHQYKNVSYNCNHIERD